MKRIVLFFVISIATAGRLGAQVPSIQVLHSFLGPPQGKPKTPLTQASDGNFYGTTGKGANSFGSVYKVTPDGLLTSLYTFTGGADGADPEAGLTQGADGNFYGTTAGGGNPNGNGAIFKITPAGVLTTLYTFTGGADGGDPTAGLVQGADGNFYGTTFGGGNSNGDGTVFKMTPGGVLTTLYTFTGGSDGAYPQAGLTQGNDGNFYGTNNSGVFFRITPTGALTAFGAFVGGGNVAFPSGLTLGSDGNFYGTTKDSINGQGTAFMITPGGTLTTLFTFSGANGERPQAGLIQGRDGNFYGATEGGGNSNGDGTVFQLTPAGVLTNLYTFTGGADGAFPEAALTQGSDGNFYSTTSGGGDGNGDGTVFKITPAGVLTTLYTFLDDGANPASDVIQGSDGNFYGTTSGGYVDNGTIFKITPDGIYTILHTFTGGVDGALPQAGLTQGSDGNLYGTTMAGDNSSENGGVFKITPAGVFTPLYAFTGGADGSRPLAGLTQGSDGNLYGTTYGGFNTNENGTVFEITPAGVLTTLYTFTGGADGADPSGLTLGSDGNLYGTASSGGNIYGDGTAFKITPAGVLTTLYTFTGGADGVNPEAGLLLGSDCNFYGITFREVVNNIGTVFKMTPAGVLTTLYTFANGADEASSGGGLTQDNAGNFYGTTTGSTENDGTVFQLTPGGVLTTLHTFSGADGENPRAGLTLGSDGNLYGTATYGGQNGLGVVYRLILVAPAVASQTASALLDAAFSFQIAATNNPTSFGASNLPAGLSVDASTGIISGTPTQSGTFTVGLTATNSIGAGTGALTLTVKLPTPVVTLVATAPQVVLGSGAAGVFTLSLSAPQSTDVVVSYIIKGTAINGVDYQLIKSSKKIKAGKTSKAIKIVPQGDLGGASKKVVTLVLQPEDGYTVGTTGKVKVKILAGN